MGEMYLVVINEYDYLDGNIKTIESYRSVEEAEEAFDIAIKNADRSELGYTNDYPLTRYEGVAELIKTASLYSDDDVMSIDLVKIYL